MTKVIDDSNLGYLISKIKAAFWPKTDVVQIDIDNAPTVNSNNLVKSGGVYTALNEKQNVIDANNKLDYSLINNTPTIPAAQVQSDWNATSGMGVILNKPTIPTAVTESTVSGWGFTKNAAPGTLVTNATTAQTASSGESMSGSITLHKVAKTGTYSDLIGKPTIPSAVTESTVSGWGFTKNTGTITGITMNGSSKGTSGVIDLGTVITSHQDISGKANDSAVVHNTGAETIAGLKTFSNGISTPSDITTRSLTITGQEPDALEVQSWDTIYNVLDNESLDDHITDLVGTLTSGKANDTAVVHLAGEETITGNKTFNGSVYLPDPSSIYFTDTQEGLDEIINSIPNITISSSEPTSSQGSNGDIWIVV